MAVFFGLWAECDDEIALGEFREHFHPFNYKLLSGREIRFRADIENNDILGLNVWSNAICPMWGIDSLQGAVDATEAGIILHHRLKTAPDFRFAHVGWNAEMATSVDLIEDMSASDGRLNLSDFECVLNDEFYRKLGSPIPFWEFREGYWWRKYVGESYVPLNSSDQTELNVLCERLLPGNFDRSGGIRQ